jgi:hypothetical protein
VRWGCSSAGRAPALQAGGQRFDPAHLHQKSLFLGRAILNRLKKRSESTDDSREYGLIAQPVRAHA